MEVIIKSNIKWLIAKSGYSQKEVADLMEMSPQQLNKWATGKEFPRIDKAIKLSRIIKCTLNDMYEIMWK